MVKIFCFGNEFVECDSLAKEIVDSIDGYEFVKLDNPEDIMEFDDFIVLDVVKGLDEVRFVYMDELKKDEITSLHDFDLGFFLQLMKKMDKLGKVRIIGLPQKGDKEKIRKDLVELLNQLNI